MGEGFSKVWRGCFGWVRIEEEKRGEMGERGERGEIQDE